MFVLFGAATHLNCNGHFLKPLHLSSFLDRAIDTLLSFSSSNTSSMLMSSQHLGNRQVALSPTERVPWKAPTASWRGQSDHTESSSAPPPAVEVDMGCVDILSSLAFHASAAVSPLVARQSKRTVRAPLACCLWVCLSETRSVSGALFLASILWVPQHAATYSAYIYQLKSAHTQT